MVFWQLTEVKHWDVGSHKGYRLGWVGWLPAMTWLKNIKHHRALSLAAWADTYQMAPSQTFQLGWK